jgi:hypothetical protein
MCLVKWKPDSTKNFHPAEGKIALQVFTLILGLVEGSSRSERTYQGNLEQEAEPGPMMDLGAHE